MRLWGEERGCGHRRAAEGPLCGGHGLCLDRIRANSLAMVSHQFPKMSHCGEIGKAYMGALCISPYNRV